MDSDSVIEKHRRESKRIKAASLNKEVADIIVTQLELVESLFDDLEKKEDSAVEKFCSDIDECLQSVNDKYLELETVTENTVDETTTNMYAAFRTELKQKREKLQELLEQRQRLAHELADEELALQQTAEAYNEQLTKFNRLMAKMKVIQETPTQITALPTIQHNLSTRASPSAEIIQVDTQSAGQFSQNRDLNPVKELADSLITTMKATRRSTPAPPVYDGDPISFQDWEIDFDSFIESEGLTGKEPLRYLKIYVSGKAKDAISGHFITNTEKAYLDARKELKGRFGSKHNVDRALRDKLAAWPKIGVRDSTELRSYADFLLHVKSAMANVPELESLSGSKENENLAAKLPDWLIRSWARKVKEKRKAEQKYPEFAEFVDFVVDHTEVADEPLMKLCSTSRETKRKPKGNPGSGNLRTFNTSSTREMCVHCTKPHPTSECFVLSRMTDEKREAFIKEHKLCWGCLHNGHRSKECGKRATCKKCNKRHPTILHKEPGEFKARSQTTDQSRMLKKTEEAKEENEAQRSAKDHPTKQAVKATGVQEGIMSMVVPIYVSTAADPNKRALVYALLDTQSDSSYMTTKTAEIINAEHTVETVTMDTLNGESTTTIHKYKNIRIQGYEQKDYAMVEAYGWDKLTGNVKNIPNKINVGKYPHLKDHAKKFPPPLDIPIGMLIGADCPQAFAPLEAVLGKAGEPFAQKTMLGWTILGGKRKNYQHQENMTRANATATTYSDSDENLMVSQDDLKFLDIMEHGIHTNEEGYLEAPLPFRLKPFLPNNRIQAEKRLFGLQKKMNKDDSFKQEYNSFMEDLLKRGHAEQINDPPNCGHVWYIPHFAVTHPKKKKLRVVFDCSATFGGTSLNEHLLQGPDLTNNMLGILLRFRKEPIAIACDVEKMFHNFYVNKEDRDFLRFLWFGKDGDIKDYRMRVHLFGATSSPAVATYSLQKLADQHEETSAASEFIKRNFYVDDGITSVSTTAEAIELITEARNLCKKGNLRLHKFVSNKMEALRELPDTERAIQDVDLYSDNLPAQRTLGLEWSVNKDVLRFTNSGIKQKPSTRRGILSTVSQLYDPLGFLAPYTLVGKKILQKVNKSGTDWDEPIAKDVQEPWKKWVQELDMLDTIKIPRCIKPTGFGTVKRRELHHFCDASMDGIGACSYIRLINENNDIHTSLLLAKSRVIPSKGITTVPRLELQGAVMATQLSAILHRELDITVDSEEFWTDSEIVLAYLANEQKRFHVYVANRIREIKMCSGIQQWHHVSSRENPADIASRGTGCHQLKTSMWLNGPKFLKCHNLKDQFEKQPSRTPIDDKDPEVKQLKGVKTTKLQQETIYHSFTKFSSLKRLVTSIAYLRQMAAKRSWKNLQSPDLEDLKSAQEVVIKIAQCYHFKQDLLTLKDTQNQLPKRSNLLPLNPYIDTKGLLRVGGRTNKSTVLTEDEKHPIIIPRNCHLGKLMIRDIHEKAHHLGTAYTASATRQNGFWIIGGTKTTKEIIKNCTICRRLRGFTETQMMGDLPAERVENTPPFTNVGVDCFGPFQIKERRSELKRWGVLFTCLFSRAIHVEVVDDLSTDAFLNTLRCFMAIRGPVSLIFCDNGTNFVGAKNELERQLEIMSDKKTKDFMKQHQIEFKMTSPTASHQGGVWERQIRSIRSVLNEISLKYAGRMDTTMLRTALYEAMATVNSRPITAAGSEDPNSTVITPNHLLTQKASQVAPPPGDFSEEDIYSRARWRRVQSFANDFWNIWKTDYLSSITKRQKWTTAKENLAEGDLVLLTENDKPRNQWQIAVVEEVHPGTDGLVRNVTIRLGNKHLDCKGIPLATAVYLRRPIQKLVLLQRKYKNQDSSLKEQGQSTKP
ncbi:uncharacterized protein [Watersipora subatra]|uniref:uncharacterized protein n=1 Tax=Watersipora subatra TaxID=2589382 RepID=UPI00355BD590